MMSTGLMLILILHQNVIHEAKLIENIHGGLPSPMALSGKSFLESGKILLETAGNCKSGQSSCALFTKISQEVHVVPGNQEKLLHQRLHHPLLCNLHLYKNAKSGLTRRQIDLKFGQYSLQELFVTRVVCSSVVTRADFLRAVVRLVTDRTTARFPYRTCRRRAVGRL
jgi:hypothetical protein